MAFVPLFCQSHHSPLGVTSASELVRRARNLGYNTLGLCDEGTIAAFREFDQACRAQGIRPVFGCRLRMMGLTRSGTDFPVDFLIETEQGYRNLVRLLTVYHQKGCDQRRPLTHGQILGRIGGLVTVIPADGELGVLIRERERKATEAYLGRLVQVFGDDFLFGGTLGSGEETEVAEMIVRLADFVQVRAFAAPVIPYPDPGDAAASVFLQHPFRAPSRSYRPPAQTKDLLAMLPESEVLQRWKGPFEELAHEAGNLARRCTWRPGRIRRAFPAMDLERGFDPNSYLFDLVIGGATECYGEITESLKQRINREFEDVRANNLAPWLLLYHQISQALDDRGISRGVGRSRIVCSVLAYCLGITLVDPLQYNLKTKGLLVDGESYPTITVEIPRTGVAALLTWIRETFGEAHLAEIGRVHELRRDHMINELARWAGMTEEERRMTHREKARLRTVGAAQRLDELTESTRTRRWRAPAFLGDLATRLAPRPHGWHATGDRYALCAEPLESIAPLVQSMQKRPVTGIDEPAIDAVGLARIHFAPHRLLDILDKAMHGSKTENPQLHFHKIALDDRATFDLLGRGDTAGVPPLEGVTLRCLLKKYAPRNLLQVLRVQTEAQAQRADRRTRELSDDLPDALLAYQCAYLKANHPLAFYTAALDSTIEQGHDPSALIREIRRAGIHVHAPDINLSEWETTSQGGTIRLGLAAIKGFGRRAWENVQSVRSGGNFASLDDFCNRVDTRILNLRILRVLIASGALDGFEQPRAAMDAIIALMQKKARERKAHSDAAEGQTTLFPLDEWAERVQPDADGTPQPAEWNNWTKLQRESESMGFFLSIDPIARFRIVLEHLRPLSVDKVTRRHLGRRLSVAGLVCSAETDGPLIARQGDTLIDLEGLPVIIGGEIARTSKKCLQPGAEVLVAGRFSREDGTTWLRAEGIWRLADLEDQATKVAKLKLNLAGENSQTIKHIQSVCREYPGSTELELDGYPTPKGWAYRRLSRSAVFFCSPLYQRICRILPSEHVQLYGHGGDILLVKTNSTDQNGPTANSESTSG